MSKIIGVTVGTPTSPTKMEKEMGAVTCKPQVLTVAQKAQARDNIDAVGVDEIGDLVKTEAVLYTPQTLTDEEKFQARINIEAMSAMQYDTEVVKRTPQFLTDEEKAQARANIGAAAVGEGGGSVDAEAVLYTEQTLTEEQQGQARANIGAVAFENIVRSGTVKWDGNIESRAVVNAVLKDSPVTFVKVSDGVLTNAGLSGEGAIVIVQTPDGIVNRWRLMNLLDKGFIYIGDWYVICISEEAVGKEHDYNLSYSGRLTATFPEAGIYFRHDDEFSVRSLTPDGYYDGFRSVLKQELLPDEVITFNEQSLTEEEKAQARANIGAAAVGEGGGGSPNAVLYTEQTLTPEEQTKARANIGAAGSAEVVNIRTGYDGTVYPTAGDAVRAQALAAMKSSGDTVQVINETSTHNQIPTAKAVYDAIRPMQEACLEIVKIEPSANKFNPATATQQNFSGGSFTDDAGFIMSDVIKCNWGDTIYARVKYGNGGFAQGVFATVIVDENGTTEQVSTYSFGKYTLPNSHDSIQNLKGVRVFFSLSNNASYNLSFENRENIAVSINADLTEYVEYSGDGVTFVDKVEKNREFLQAEIDKKASSVNGQTPDENGNVNIEFNIDEDYLLGKRSTNLFDKSKAVMDCIIFNYNGGMSEPEYPDYFSSGYIEVTPGVTYTMTSNGSAAFYKEVNGEPRFLSNPGMILTVTAPDGAKYIRFCANKAYLETFMFAEGDTLLPYQPYGLFVDPDNIGEDSLIKIKQYIDESATDEEAVFDPNYLTRLRDHLANPFVRTQITLVGDSITAGVGGTGFDTESPESGIIGDGSGSTKANVLTATCWSNMLYWYVMNNYNGKACEVDVMADGVSYTVPYRRSSVTISGDPVLRYAAIISNDSIVENAVTFRFYGTSAVVKYAKGTAFGKFNVYVDDVLKADVDCYSTSETHDNAVNITGLSESYHTLRIAMTNSKNDNSSANTVHIEGFVVTKYAVVNPWGIGGLTSGVAGNRGFYSVNDDFVIMQFGTNDRGTSLGRESTTVNLVNAVKMIKTEFGADVILMCANPTTYTEEFEQYGKNFHMWDVKAAVAKAASILRMPYIDNYDAFLRYCDTHGAELSTLLADNLHPNDLGYKVMFENIMRSVDLPLIHLFSYMQSAST